MQIQNTFLVPAPPDAAWRMLLDVPFMARCVPGATLEEAREDRSYRGSVAVKLGPVRLTFSGEARITELDDAARRAKVEARGSDTKGRGTASAQLAFALVPEGEGSRVDVVTDLQLVGAVAQYGRGAGLIKEVANQLVGSFAENLRREIAAANAAPAAPQTAPAEPAAPAVASSPEAAPAPKPTSPPPTGGAPPVSGLSLLLRALGAVIANWIRGLFSAGRG